MGGVPMIGVRKISNTQVRLGGPPPLEVGEPMIRAPVRKAGETRPTNSVETVRLFVRSLTVAARKEAVAAGKTTVAGP